jgi:hypothetical protein
MNVARCARPSALLGILIAVAGIAIASSLPAPATAQVQSPTVDALIARVYTEPNPQPYTMTADFNSDVVLRLPTGMITVKAVGTLTESRAAAGQPRTRKATVTRLDVPVLLRPFSNSIRKVVTDAIELEQKPNEILPTQDIFIAEERAPDKYLLGGVRTDIVNDTMVKYKQQALMRDTAARRAIAKWLWSPSQRGSIVRGGPGPYMLAVLLDETGLIHQLTLHYDWGQVGNRIQFVTVGGRPFWREVVSDTASELAGIGHVEGRMTLLVQNHCLNCTR